MNRAILAIGGSILAAAVLLLINIVMVENGAASESDSQDRNGNGSRALLNNKQENPIRSKSQRRKDGLVSQRSKAWILAREIEQCFPDLNSVIITDATHSVEREGKVPAQVNLPAEKWKILGYTNDSGLEPLTIINTGEGIRRVFAGIYAETGDESFSTNTPGRSLVVNLIASENKQYSQEAQGNTGGSPDFPFIFDLTVYWKDKAQNKPLRRTDK